MTAVTQFEAGLIRLARGFVGALPTEQFAPILRQRVPQPPGLTANAVRLIEDTLRKGMVQFLVRAGGWRQDRFLRGDKAEAGHPWQRVPLPERQLKFSDNVLSFLIWLACERPTVAREFWQPNRSKLTVFDDLFFLQVAAALQPFEAEWTILCGHAPFATSTLVALGGFTEFIPDFTPLITHHSVILECLQSWLAAHWIGIDEVLANSGDTRRVRARGVYYHSLFDAYLTAIANRRDLARFLLQAMRQRTSPDLSRWTSLLKSQDFEKLQDRQATREAAVWLMKQSATFETWEREARRVSYFDEEYAISQFWKAEYAAHDGLRIASDWRTLQAQLDPLEKEAA